MQRLLSAGDLHDNRGHLVEAGWATSEARRYRRAAVTASRWRIKEWDYYCILGERYGLALTVADNGYMGVLACSWMDFEARRAWNESVMLPFPMGRMKLPESADSGDIVQNHPKMSLGFHHAPGGRRVTVNCPGYGKGRGLKGELYLTQPPMDRMVIATPFAGKPRAFYYNQKINCLPAEGEIVIGGDRCAFSPSTDFGVLDWGRGVWTYDNTWYWGSASGLVDGAPFGFNIGYGFGDTAAASENMAFWRGKAHKLDQVKFHMPEGTFDGAPWRFTSNDARFEMNFEPIVDRAASFDLKFLRSIQHQVFGRFTGHVILDDGTRLDVRDLIGFAEQVQNRW